MNFAWTGNLMRLVALLACVTISSPLFSANVAFAETGAEAWLRYAVLQEGAPSFPNRVAVLGNSDVARTAGSELVRALVGKPGKRVPTSALPNADALVLGTWNGTDGRAPTGRKNQTNIAGNFSRS